MRVIAVLTVIGTALAAAYLLRVLYLLWHGAVPAEVESTAAEPEFPGRADKPARADATTLELAVTLPLVVATIVLGLLPSLLLDLTAPAAHLLLGLGRGVV